MRDNEFGEVGQGDIHTEYRGRFSLRAHHRAGMRQARFPG